MAETARDGDRPAQPRVLRMLAVAGRISWQLVGIAVALWIAGQAYVQLSLVLLAVFVALVVAAAVTPAAQWLEDRVRLGRTVATTVVIATVVALLAGTGYLLANRLSSAGPALVDDVRAQRGPVLRALEQSPLQLSEEEVLAIVDRTLDRVSGEDASLATSGDDDGSAGDDADPSGGLGDAAPGADDEASADEGAGAGGAGDDEALPDDQRGPSPSVAVVVLPRVLRAAQTIGYLLLGLVLAFFLVRDRDLIADATVENLVGGDHDRLAYTVMRRSWRALIGYVRASLAVGAIEGAVIGLVLVIVGVPLAGVLALLTFLAAFVPVVGAVVVGVLSVAVAFVSNGPGAAIVVGIAILVVQQLDGNVLQPMLVRVGTGLHPVATILALVVGGTLGGVLGALLAVPVTAMLVAAAAALLEAGLGDPAAETGVADAARSPAGT